MFSLFLAPTPPTPLPPFHPFTVLPPPPFSPLSPPFSPSPFFFTSLPFSPLFLFFLFSFPQFPPLASFFLLFSLFFSFPHPFPFFLPFPLFSPPLFFLLFSSCPVLTSGVFYPQSSRGQRGGGDCGPSPGRLRGGGLIRARPGRAAPLPCFLPSFAPSVRPSAARDVVGRQPEHHAAAGGAAEAGGGRGEDQGERGADEPLLPFLPPLSAPSALAASRGEGDERCPRWGSVALSAGRSCDK